MKRLRADYTLEFKKEAVRLVRGGQRQSEVSASLGISGQTLHNWVKADAAGRLTEREGVRAISQEQMEISRLKAELARVRMERDILKNGRGFRQGIQVRYAFIEAHQNVWPVVIQCRVLQVSACGFRAWRKRRREPPSARPGGRVGDLALLTHIRAEFTAGKQTCGWPRMVRQLRARGLAVGKERVRKTMKAHDILVRARRRFKQTTDSSHNSPIAPKLLNREFATSAPNRVRVGDITYVWTAEGWLCLATVIDLFSRQLVGFAFGERMGAENVWALKTHGR